MAVSHVSQAEVASSRRRGRPEAGGGGKAAGSREKEFWPPVAWRRTGCGPYSGGPRRSMSGAPPSPPEPALQTRLVENQPYDESLDVNETEDVASIYAPSPPQPGPRAARPPCKDSSDEDEDGGEAALKGGSTPPRAPGWDPVTAPDRPVGALLQPEKKGGGPLGSGRRFSGHEVEDDDEDSSETDSDEDEDDEDDEHGAPLEGAYNSADYDYLPVSLEVKELFQYIRRYSSQMIDLEHKLKPFIPDFIPAVGDIDAFLKVPRPDGKPDNLGLLMLDEPSTKQSDPTVLSLWLTENSKQHNVAQQVKVKSLENAEKNPKAVDSWIESISELHHCKPPATVHYARPMPDIDTLMQEWSPEFEELLGKVSLPTADIDCSLAEYTDMICAMLDIPVYKGHIQPLHTLFSLYSEFKNSQHFKALAEGKKVASPPSNPPSQAGETDILSFT
ncbi:intraflagellar transport protein 46 homolog isoform X1 [Pseudonaja textilis]|uniref:intraflagellar transport protein 46 homolog isoform X1 n=1 Tax=Pseudonaja textilis TaxID=8673 RepID=UPI000EA980F5|nr:intraflagellar transport protein 46 homolog isoform X1 [Pseudonaja textilis]